MGVGLSVARIVQVSVTLSPNTVPARNFGASMVVGSSPVIDTVERLREYNDIDGVIDDFGTTAPETVAATLHFSQVPQPDLLYIGRWAQNPTNGLLHGAILTPAQQMLANFNAITAGSLVISVIGNQYTLENMNFAQCVNLNAVAYILQAEFTTVGSYLTSVVWNSVYGRFEITCGGTGPQSTVGYGTPTAIAGQTDVSGLLGLRQGQAEVPVNGVPAETYTQAIFALADISNDWYAASLAAPVEEPAAESDIINASLFIEASSPSRIHLVSLTDTACLDPTRSDDLGSQLKALNLARTLSQFSSNNPYSVVSLFARMATTDFNANNSTIIVMFKTEPGIVSEKLTASEASALQAKNISVFAYYQNGASIIQYGAMANGDWLDERQGLDWYQNELQTNVFNFFLTQPKIPQTDPGMNLIGTVIDATNEEAVNNGFFAPGVWNGPKFGTLNTGDTLPTGYYTYIPLVAAQTQADRKSRISVPYQVAAKLAGGVQDAIIAVQADR